MKPEYNFGDLVRVDGYFPRIFQIDGIRVETWSYPDEQWTDTIYELYDVATNDWIEAISEDLTFITDAGQADEFLRENPAPILPSLMADFTQYTKEAESMAKGERKPTARELSAIEADRRKKERKERASQIDNLLDQRNWYAGMLTKTNDETYGDRVVAIDCELKKLTEDDEREGI